MSYLVRKIFLLNAYLININNIDEKNEAELLSIIAIHMFHIPEEKILIEDRSTNCGQNADFSRDLLGKGHFDIKTAILVQDPLMQRRAFETFAYSWKQQNVRCQFTNWPVFKPKLLMTRTGPKIIGGQLPGQWDIERYISMILGEMKRLYNDLSGYGPKGAGFIDHVSIPTPIVVAWQRLLSEPVLMRITR